MEPTTGYAVLDGQRIAYQVIGDGPIDLVIAPSWFSAFDIEWEEPQIRLYLQRLASNARVIRLDRRGSGASDPLPSDDTSAWENFAEDISCVMNAVESKEAFVYADGDVGPLGILFAATHPERVRGLILFNTSARFRKADDYPIGFPAEFIDSIRDEITGDWGTGERLELYVPSRAADQRFQRWMGRFMRAVTTPSSVRRYMDAVLTADVRSFLSALHMPVLVLHPAESMVPAIDHGRFLAEKVPDGRLVALDGPGDAFPYFELADQVLASIEDFISAATPAAASRRTLATVVFTDIVGSTERAAALGDDRWRDLIDIHDEIARRESLVNGGEVVKATGDGIVGMFDGPGRAIRFVTSLRRELADLDLTIRAGIHTGEIEVRNGDIGGIAVHIAARIMAAAGDGRVFVSRTVKDLVIGSSVKLESCGAHSLKGIEGDWELYELSLQ